MGSYISLLPDNIKIRGWWINQEEWLTLFQSLETIKISVSTNKISFIGCLEDDFSNIQFSLHFNPKRGHMIMEITLHLFEEIVVGLRSTQMEVLLGSKLMFQ